MSKDNEKLEFDCFQVIPHERLLLRNGQPVQLQHKAFDILLTLVRASGSLVEKDELMEKVWPDKIVEETNLTSYISQLRNVLGDNRANPKYIQTVPKMGYRFIAPVKEVQGNNTVVIRDSSNASPIIAEKQQQPRSDKTESQLEQSIVVLDEAQVKPGLLGDHAWFALTACAMYASLYGVVLLVETAYEFDRYGGTVLRIGPLVFTWILFTSIAGLALDRKRIIQGKSDGLGLSWLVFVFTGLILFAALYQFLPDVPVTQAKFQTHTAQSVYLKEVFYFCSLATLYLIMPFHFIVTMEQALSQGKHQAVLEMLTGSYRSVLPKGVIYIKPQLLGFLLVLITLWALIVRAYVLDQLLPGPYMNLFIPSPCLLLLPGPVFAAALGATSRWPAGSSMRWPAASALIVSTRPRRRRSPPRWPAMPLVIADKSAVRRHGAGHRHRIRRRYVGEKQTQLPAAVRTHHRPRRLGRRGAGGRHRRRRKRLWPELRARVALAADTALRRRGRPRRRQAPRRKSTGDRGT